MINYCDYQGRPQITIIAFIIRLRECYTQQETTHLTLVKPSGQIQVIGSDLFLHRHHNLYSHLGQQIPLLCPFSFVMEHKQKSNYR